MVMESQTEVKASMPQVLVINPKNSLLFKGPSNQPANVQIGLTNPSTKWVAFKVKTTAPKRYCVRPNGGFIRSNESCSVNIAYQPGDGPNDAAERLKHKFLVQAIFTDNDQVHLDQIWKDVPKDQIMESKIRCVFDDADTGDNVGGAGGGSGQPKGDVLSAPDVTGGVSDAAKSMAHTVEAATRSGMANVGQTELELRRMGEDYRRAQDEINNLRDENRRLRDESARMKKSIQSIGQSPNTSGISSVQSGFGSSQDFVGTLKTDLTKVTTIVALLVAMFVGLILSKIF
ncbi:hypothetical protein RvY_18260 [Ramazzottius varieornatus]|uniref:MSP domain-containing protein n=1 Tax=Ramazzottius varieornatus TaxID=947166 RepID=A0A1D1W540_RAMVA|nr:hypothetical protein RvY_18260 [Ramazzottius varieornatus]